MVDQGLCNVLIRNAQTVGKCLGRHIEIMDVIGHEVEEVADFLISGRFAGAICGENTATYK